MPEDDNVVVPEEEVIEPEAEVIPEPEPETPEPQEDYRGKLNANVRFLKKEGYEFKDGKWQKPAVAPTEAAPTKEPKPATLTRDEAILIAKGFSEEEVEKAKKIAEVEGIKLSEVPTNDIFTTWKTKRDAEAKNEAAQLGVGRGSRASAKKSFDTKGLSDEEHKELFKEEMGG